MKNLTLAAAFAAGLLAGCMAGAPPTTAQRPPASPAGYPATPGAPLGSPFADRHGFARTLETPLIIDRTDLTIGTTVQFDRIPTAADLHDLLGLGTLTHIVLSLPGWPVDFAPL